MNAYSPEGSDLRLSCRGPVVASVIAVRRGERKSVWFVLHGMPIRVMDRPSAAT